MHADWCLQDDLVTESHAHRSQLNDGLPHRLLDGTCVPLNRLHSSHVGKAAVIMLPTHAGKQSVCSTVNVLPSCKMASVSRAQFHTMQAFRADWQCPQSHAQWVMQVLASQPLLVWDLHASSLASLV